MKITFFSNMLNHHQLPLCEAFLSIPEVDFTFVATEPTHKERLELGYHEMNESYDFCICAYKDEHTHRTALNLGLNSDVVIIGSAPDVYIEERLQHDKLTFRYSERLFKQHKWLSLVHPKFQRMMGQMHRRYKNNKLYMLCASAYAKKDFSLLGAYKGKTIKWGYFPAIQQCDVKCLLQKKEKPILEIVWCGRMIDWKRPEHAVYVAKYLARHKKQFKLKMIGIGERQERLKQLIDKWDLNGYIDVLGAMAPEQVRQHMDDAAVLLFTSNHREGWGAVLNEAMNSACAVVAYQKIGSAGFMVNDGTNAKLYKTKRQLARYTLRLLDDYELRMRMGRNAYSTTENTWNATVAAQRFVKLSEHLYNGGDVPSMYSDGPCSRA
ncbi:glycosyltransferase [Eubacteriales bacterium OttesenSCG-928-M02]|nr:glycosyltransferase [Eubacteriales bacterium OttesenSCG-928-M02]